MVQFIIFSFELDTYSLALVDIISSNIINAFPSENCWWEDSKGGGPWAEGGGAWGM